MESLTIRAHYDGHQILLDEPVQLAPNTKLIITVLQPDDLGDQDDWTRLSLAGLARAYDDDEPEYPLSLVKEANADYKS